MSDRRRLFLDLDHTTDIARRFRDAYRPNLIQQSGIWYDYTGTHYAEIEEATLSSAMQRYLSSAFVGRLGHDRKTMLAANKTPKPLSFAPYHVGAVVKALGNEVHKPAATYKSPSWLDRRAADPRTILPCRNGLFDIETRELKPHSPLFFCTYCLPLDYNPDVPVPQKWLDVLDQIYGGRQHLIDAQQEVFGYMISGDRSRDKIILHRGVPRGGKGLIAAVQRNLVGESNTVSFSFGGSESTLGDKHGLHGAENALLIQIPDISVGRHSSGFSAACTRLKEISGGDPVPVRPLYGKTVSMILPGLIDGGMNGIPNFGTDADALAARILFFPHDVSFRGREDTTLRDRRKSPLLTIEALTGILNWSIVGLDRLNKRGHFDECPESFELKQLMLRASNPIVAFIDSECELKRGTSVEKVTLWHVYRDWCAAQGMDFKIENHFSSALQTAVTALGVTLKDRRASADDGSRPRDWGGIRLNTENRVRYYEHDPVWLADPLFAPEGKPTQHTFRIETNSGRLIPAPWKPHDDERDHTSDFAEAEED